MNPNDAPYKDFALVREMWEAPTVMETFDYEQVEEAVAAVKRTGKLMLTGEGSSRIFPAKNFIAEALKAAAPLQAVSEGSHQAGEYDLRAYTVFGASNSGQTKEIIALFQRLTEQGHANRFGVTANQNTKLETVTDRCYLLQCGKEAAVAATKSVVEQALFYQSMLCALIPEKGGSAVLHNREAAAQAARDVLAMELCPEMIEAIAGASLIYFAGRNNGVAEELTLKTNEITRKKSDFLEGTYAVHGVEEVMEAGDVVILVDPFESEEEKFKHCLVDNVKMKVFAVSSRQTSFPTVQIPHVWGFDSFLQLLAGWNLLAQVGLRNGINLDKPVRARKVGNEFTE